MVAKKISPVVYEVKDIKDDDAEPVLVSVQSIVRLKVPTIDTSSAPLHLRSDRDCFKRGKFLIFRVKGRTNAWKKRIYVAEAHEEYDRDNDTVALHYYTDLGPRDGPRVFDPTKPLTERRLRPEY